MIIDLPAWAFAKDSKGADGGLRRHDEVAPPVAGAPYKLGAPSHADVLKARGVTK